MPTALAFVIAIAGFGLDPAYAQRRAPGGATPPRLSFIDGEVSFWRPGAQDWTQAQVNTALAAGDSLYAADSANFEIQIGLRAFVRGGSATEIDLTSLDPNYTQFRITGGHAAFDLKKLPGGQTIEVDTPNGAFTTNRPGYYRVDVDADGNTTTFSVRRGGLATAAPAAGAATSLAENQQIVLVGTDTVQVNVTAAPALDAWDHWNNARTAQLAEVPRSVQYVPPNIAGVDDLDRFGDWQEQPRYGHVWVPRDMPPDWAPYSSGRWVYDPYYQWTWVDSAPWGWAPYHYGRWVHTNGFWGWAPGPVIAAPVYSPALVAFFGGNGGGVSVSVGLPFVSWCALGFGEPVTPWWGGSGFAGRPYWGGWGGPRVVNNTVINNTKIVNVTNITRYENANVPNAVMGVDRTQFGRGRTQPVRLDAQRVQQLQPVHGGPGVRPVAASLVPREATGRRPPEHFQARQVVSTRPPPDPINRLRAAGIQANQSVTRPAPRVVRPQHGQPVQATGPQAGMPAGDQPPPHAPGHPPGGVGAGPPALPRASGRSMPPPPPPHQGARPGQAPPPAPSGGGGPHPVPPMPPAVPAQHRPAPSQQRQPAHVEPPVHPQAAPQQRTLPQPPPRERQPSHVEPPARPQAPPQQRSLPAPPAHERQPSHVEPPARPQAPPPQQRAVPAPPPREPAAPHQPLRQPERTAPRPQAAPWERPAPKQSYARPQAPPRERPAPRQSVAPPQAAPRERAARQQPSRPQAPPRERSAPQHKQAPGTAP